MAAQTKGNRQRICLNNAVFQAKTLVPSTHEFILRGSSSTSARRYQGHTSPQRPDTFPAEMQVGMHRVHAYLEVDSVSNCWGEAQFEGTCLAPRRLKAMVPTQEKLKYFQVTTIAGFLGANFLLKQGLLKYNKKKQADLKYTVDVIYSVQKLYMQVIKNMMIIASMQNDRQFKGGTFYPGLKLRDLGR